MKIDNSYFDIRGRISENELLKGYEGYRIEETSLERIEEYFQIQMDEDENETNYVNGRLTSYIEANFK